MDSRYLLAFGVALQLCSCVEPEGADSETVVLDITRTQPNFEVAGTPHPCKLTRQSTISLRTNKDSLTPERAVALIRYQGEIHLAHPIGAPAPISCRIIADPKSMIAAQPGSSLGELLSDKGFAPAKFPNMAIIVRSFAAQEGHGTNYFCKGTVIIRSVQMPVQFPATLSGTPQNLRMEATIPLDFGGEGIAQAKALREYFGTNPVLKLELMARLDPRFDPTLSRPALQSFSKNARPIQPNETLETRSTAPQNTAPKPAPKTTKKNRAPNFSSHRVRPSSSNTRRSDLLQRLDRDHNGEISKAEAGSEWPWLSGADRDDNLVISPAELDRVRIPVDVLSP